ncbi:AraC family transcriptional regulator [Clostridium tagluense]|uniref:helix-turn-helix domain-containing protein n=1 Tax=Clostridium tagluense TaxID=360422 RepID=UPI001CF54B57|nr:AraC family transcriptional regulator [Clostridium tagluense]MCB2312634.1 AraC family transcriptional regulator [Clostridium tagluense]MCB2317310.1 AraC family transcriptional regulator [Clostridium tagluense]MCB2322177.1 AraC family transcriptional regulator [Clostridium tagluense]MCB2327106.1 AraC family transcriptional regulator [Clostridium tagluense]MCB2331824.1 AraC family transcriptional regulator [Clostridium tagluense]
MIVKSNEEFKEAVLKTLSFSKTYSDNYTLYTNKKKPELGHLISYSREGYYNLGIADYTITEDFDLSFDNPQLLMRFGIVYKGATEFKIENNPVSSFTPSSFFVIEKNLKGQQSWKKGQHFHGTEITIFENYFNDIIKPNFPNVIDFNTLIKNYTYIYLPLEIVEIIHQLQSLSNQNSLNSIYLESKILECIAILINEVTKSKENAFTNQINYGNINIGSNRTIKLTSSDIHAIQKSHDILEKNYTNPPNIESLSKMVFLNEQKLKAGFSKHYHMSIGEYTNHLKMTVSANLLSTTDLSIEHIAYKVGYNYSANFSKMFKKTYGKTPLKFRKTK